MRVAIILLLACLIFFVVACQSESPTSTPRPTYTPYPTYTPAPTPTPEPTATARPTPTEASSPTATPRPRRPVTYTPPTITLVRIGETSTPEPTEEFPVYGIGDKEYFSAAVMARIEEGLRLYEDGRYTSAIGKFKQALTAHGEPSSVLENRIGLAYDALGQYEMAIEHYTNSIEIEDSSIDRVNRSLGYFYMDQCDKAMEDAKVALALEPEFTRGYHTDAEANTIISHCYF